MKLIAIILALFIIYIAVTPCSDESTCEYDIEHASGHDNENDDCTAFCTCDCCSTLVVLTNIIVLHEISNIQPYTYISDYSFYYNYEYKIGVWRPPSSC